MRILILLMVMLAATAPVLSQVGTEEAVAKAQKIETSYDSGKIKQLCA